MQMAQVPVQLASAPVQLAAAPIQFAATPAQPSMAPLVQATTTLAAFPTQACAPGLAPLQAAGLTPVQLLLPEQKHGLFSFLHCR
jgi:hypothetical protein